MTNSKLIKSPEEAIETIKANMPTSGYQMLREALDMAIEALKRECWIPVEERLPDKGERVIICTEHGFRGEAIMKQSGRYFRYGIENEKIFGQKIVAWMPLPEPYWQEKGGDGHTDT